jgi:Lyase
MTGVFGHLWETAETRELFGDEGRTRAWLSVYGALAAAQGELGLIPAAAASAISARCSRPVDLAAVAEATRRSGHSTLGLIRVLGTDLDATAREWLSYGATVQDVADTWTGLVAVRMLAIADRDLAAIDASLVDLATRHRHAAMLGRTHGQPGLPITFGFKAAVWIAEVSSPGRSGRCPRGARRGPNSSAACSTGSASRCPTSPGTRRATGSPSSSGCSRWSAGRSRRSATRSTTCSARRSAS